MLPTGRFAKLAIPPAAYEEVRKALEECNSLENYADPNFDENGEALLMPNIALVRKEEK